MKNGTLLSESVAEEFDILLTIDKNLEHQQNMGNYEIAVVVLDVEKSKIDFLLTLLPKFKEQVDNFENGNVYIIEN
ncbi:MAG: hypothetical protein M3405_00270 [Acidobacteriota bacterium]|nr:hypothetical protein [Acidobacteriota bacterium]